MENQETQFNRDVSDPVSGQNSAADFTFAGFQKPNSTPLPDEVVDVLLPILTGAQLKVVCYVCRRTFGYKKDSDAISLSQICNGITTRDGRVLDRGTGLSRSTASAAITALLKMKVLIAEKRWSKENGNETTVYALNIQGVMQALKSPKQEGAPAHRAHLVGKSNQGG